MKLPSLPASISVVLTTGAGAFVAYIASQCQVSPGALIAGGATAFVAAVVHLYIPSPVKS